METLETPAQEQDVVGYSLWQLVFYSLKLGTLLLVTVLLLWKAKKVPEPLIVLGAAIVGLIVYPVLHA